MNDRSSENRGRWRPQRGDSLMAKALEWARFAACYEVGCEEPHLVEEYVNEYYQRHGGGDLSQIAAALGGVVEGRRILAPSPGRGPADRSMVVTVDPARPDGFYIYSCAGPWLAAKTMVAKKLKVILPTQRPSAERTASALKIWGQTVPAPGTLVEVYLRSRAITMAPPATLRFHPGLYHDESRGEWPAMVALVTNVDDEPVAIHRTYLRPDGGGKAPIKPDKKVIGSIGGCAIRLASAVDEVAVGEGIETCLSVLQTTGLPTWSALSNEGVKALVLPGTVRKVTILADNDPAGEEAARFASRRWKGEKMTAPIARPSPGFNDFNDMLRGKRSDHG